VCRCGRSGGAQYSVQWHFSPTFSNPVSLSTRLLALSSLLKQQKNLTKPLRLRGVRPSSSVSLLDSPEVDDAGLRGMVALAKIRESRLRCCVCGVVCDEWLARVDEDEDGEESCVAVCDGNDVSSGESIWRFARGDVGNPVGSVCVNDDIVSSGARRTE
jgi:hypothetical protein